MTCLIWSHRRPFSASCTTTYLSEITAAPRFDPTTAFANSSQVSSQKRGAPMFFEEKIGWKFTFFSSWMIQMIHLQHLRGTSKSGVFVSTIFTVSLWGDRRLKGLPTDVIIPISKTHLLGAKDFTPKLVAILMIWQVDFFFGNGRISHRWSMIHHRNVLWPYTKVRLPLVVITVLGYIITSWNDLIQNKVVEKVNSLKKNIIKRPFRMLALWM